MALENPNIVCEEGILYKPAHCPKDGFTNGDQGWISTLIFITCLIVIIQFESSILPSIFQGFQICRTSLIRCSTSIYFSQGWTQKRMALENPNIVCEEATGTMNNELPDCVISYIFSKLSMKDLVKTSTLSKRWLHEWQSRMDLKFDLDNMFGSDAIREFSSSINSTVLNEFERRLDQFMMHYQGAKIRSLQLDFPLGSEHSDVIGRLISQGSAKGVERIELLFPFVTTNNGLFSRIYPYQLSYALLSESDSLKYLQLRNCLLVPPMNFSGFKNLRTLMLQPVVVEQNLLLGLFSNCIHLVDLALNDCEFNSDLKLNSPTLCHLKIVDRRCYRREAPWKIDIFALNLLSLEYANKRGTSSISYIKAPQLSEFICNCTRMPPIVFSGLKILTLKGLLIPKALLPCLFSECLQLEDLTLLGCQFESHVNIICRTLCHLNIIELHYENLHWEIDIDALNLSSFEYRSPMRISSFKAPRLSKFYLFVDRSEEIPSDFDMIASLHHLENLAMSMCHSDLQMAMLVRGLGPFQNLRKLEFYLLGSYDANMDYFLILDIVTVSPHLQKLSLTVRNSYLVARERQRREHARFFHHELKYIEFRGFTGTINEIELASHFLRNVNSLKQITFGPAERFYMGVGKWDEYPQDCNSFKRNQIREMLKNEVNDQCQLIIL